MKVILVIIDDVFSNNPRTRTVKIEGERVLIGREGADLTLRDTRCSREHALMFEDSEGKLWLKDLKSTNGTAVRGQKISAVPLQEGSVFRIGATDIELAHYDPDRRPYPEDHEPVREEETTAVDSVSGNVVTSWPEAITCLPPEKQKKFSAMIGKPDKKRG